MAIKFEVLDADSDVNFEEMVVEINGVIYEDLFKKGSGNKYNRETGEVILFGRLQLELGGLEDPRARWIRRSVRTRWIRKIR